VAECAKIKPGEQVLIVTDTLTDERITEALLGASLSHNAVAQVIIYPAQSISPHEPPAGVVAAMQASDVVFLYTGSSLTHSRARRAAQQTGARIIVMAGVNEQVFLRTLAVDLEAVAQLTHRIAGRIQSARQARLTSPLGTDLTMNLGNPVVVIDGRCHERAEIDFIPFGCLVNVPHEGSANGQVVVDGSIGALGVLSAPVTLKIEAGRIVNVEGGRDAARLRQLLAASNDPNVYTCPAEWGVGTNPGARLLGIEPTFEGERVHGWAHVALGNNDVFPGGTIRAGLHLDAILTNPMLALDNEVVLSDGQFHC
jgi:leucyl aminopeptidase (aminopeptidase T)